MVKSHRSKRHHKKHRGGEGEATDNNSVLTMDEAPAAETAMPAAPVTATATPTTAKPAEEEKKGWFSNLFGGSRTKRVRFKRTRKTKRSATKSKRSTRKHKRSTRKHKRSGSKRKGSSRK